VAASAAGFDPGAFVKSRLLDAGRRIELEEYVSRLANDLAEHLADANEFPSTSEQLGNEFEAARFMSARVERYWEGVAPLLEALIPGCAWGAPDQTPIWTRAIQRVANASQEPSGKVVLIELQKFPVLPLLYGAGMAAISRSKYDALRSVAIDPLLRTNHGRVPLISASHPWRPFSTFEWTAHILALEAEGVTVDESTFADLRSGRKGKRYTPVSDHLHAKLRPYFSDLLPDIDEYSETFDRLEILLGVIAADARAQLHEKGLYADDPYVGAFSWRDRYSSLAVEEAMLSELESLRDNWPPIQAGLFGGSTDRAITAFRAFNQKASDARMRRH
jgi:hypothetical protein